MVGLYCRSLGKNLLTQKGAASLLSSFGALWLIVSTANFFFGSTRFPELLQSLWWLFLLLGVGLGFWKCRPRMRFEEKLKDRDIYVEIAVGNVFRFEGALIIGSNTTFDTRISKDLISETSIQGQFTRKYYDDELQLDRELSASLLAMQPVQLSGPRIGKALRYPLGTTVRLSPKARTAYFLAMAEINEYGIASGSFNNLKDCLAQLWVFIGERGLKERLVMPVLGSHFLRITESRETIIQETVKSFIAACGEKTFCERLTIVLSEQDVKKYQIDILELRDFLRHVAKYTEFAINQGIPMGTPTR
jgi:hypothetical protein